MTSPRSRLRAAIERAGRCGFARRQPLFGHGLARFGKFACRYRAEFEQQRRAVETLRRLADSGPVTLVLGAIDCEHNQAIGLAARLSGAAPGDAGSAS